MEVGRIRRDEAAAATVAVARAFHRDPLFDFLIPDTLSQARAALTFMGSVIADGIPFDEVWVARSGSVITGGAVWLPPGTYPRGMKREFASIGRDLRSIHRIGQRFFSGVQLYSAIDRTHRRMAEPHWYLGLLGSDPAWQRRGVGSSLLAPVLERADDQQVPAYLETQKAENLPWYRRHGFEIVAEIEVGAAPKMWAMRRDPK